MPKFKIEMELLSINERILLTDFDSERSSNNSITFNESLTEEENGLYRLNFSIAEEFGRTKDLNIGSLISIGRPIWLHTQKPSRSIRMVISSFSPVIGTDNVIYEIEAQDYASYVFARNNAGFTIDTIFDEDFLDWLKQNNLSSPPKIEDIANHILQRGWLQKYDGNSGWDVVIDDWVPDPNNENLLPKNQINLNFEVSGSNTYGALVSLAQLSNTFLEFDYVNEKIYFWDRESLELDKNYVLQRKTNLQDFGISYSGENLYSIFYIEGGVDEFGLRTILSDATEYKDNFLFNFNYFKDRSLVTNDSAIDNEINQNLKDINIEFQNAIRAKFNTLGRIREFETQLELIADAISLASNDDHVNKYEELVEIFLKRREVVDSNPVQKTFTTPSFTAIWSTIPSGLTLEFDFPVTLSYNGSGTQTRNLSSEEFEFNGLTFEISFENETGYTSATQNGITFYYKVNSGNFDIEKLNILTSKASYTETVQWSALETIYPYFSKLDLFDGQSGIDDAKARWQSKIDTIKSLWEDAVNYIKCIDGDLTDSTCDPFWIPTGDPETDPLLLDLKKGLEERIDDYKIAIGEYDPETDTLDNNRLGKFTRIFNLFEEFEQNYTVQFTTGSVMEIYRAAQNEKQEFWYDLKEKRQHIFIEGYYDNDIESNPTDLKRQAEAIYKTFQRPSEDFSLTYVDISDVLGVDVDLISPGDFITLREEKLEIQTTEDSRLKVAEVSRVLRDRANITLSIYRYNNINQIIQKMVKQTQ